MSKITLTEKIVKSVETEIRSKSIENRDKFLKDENVSEFISSNPDQKQNLVKELDDRFDKIVSKFGNSSFIKNGLEFEFDLIDKLDSTTTDRFSTEFNDLLEEAKIIKSPIFSFLENSKVIANSPKLNARFIKKLVADIADQVEKLVYAGIKNDFTKENNKVFIDVYQKVNHIKKMQIIIKSSGDIFGNLFSIGKTQLQKIDFRTIEKYFTILKDNKQLDELANILGRFGLSYKKIDGEELQKISFKSKDISPYHPEEIVGVTIGNSLERVMPNEIANLSDPLLESIFATKYLEKKLTIFELGSSRHKKDKHIYRKVKREHIQEINENGPFIICIDTSNSMNGTPEQVAKALTLGIVRIAKKQKRNFYLIIFASQLVEISLNEITNNFEKLMDFLTMSFRGGTDIDMALDSATKKMQTSDYSKADLLVISDFDVDGIKKELADRIELLKEKGNRFHAMIINSSRPYMPLVNLFTNKWEYNVHSPNYEDVIRKLESTLNPKPLDKKLD